MNETQGLQASREPELVRLHTALGFDLLADPNDYLSSLLLRDAVFEAPETELVTHLVRPGDVCIDAGCHIGYYSCLIAQSTGNRGKVYAFDADPRACQSTARNVALNGLNVVDITQSALADRNGSVLFHLSTDDQTGLSSLGPIHNCKAIISVPCIRLDEFMRSRKLDAIRLLKLDVEGAEEMVLKGLGRFLVDHLIDFILVECYDERLQLLNSSTEKVAKLFESAHYAAWEYATEEPPGWRRAAQVRSRGDCNYVFVSPSVRESLPAVSLAGALSWGQQQLESQRNEVASLRQRLESQQEEVAAVREKLELREGEIDWLLKAVKENEQELKDLRLHKAQADALWMAVERSAGWRILNAWRTIRDSLAPPSTMRRRLYDSVIRRFRK